MGESKENRQVKRERGWENISEGEKGIKIREREREIE